MLSYRFWRWTAAIGFLSLAFGSVTWADETSVDYATAVKPLLTQFCSRCHGAEEQNSGLRLDSAAGLRQGGDSGQVLVPGKPDESRLIHAITHQNDAKPMPPEDEPQMSSEQVEVLVSWVRQGAIALDDEPAPQAVTKRSDHWAFQPVVRLAPPLVQNSAWVRNPIDAFVLERLEREQLQPSPEADRHTLIRRLSLDLVGLPPTPEEIDVFVNDPRPDAYERLVERLLVSPHYGERWGRHWLDLARYADSNGFTRDMPREIWKYREWVIQALNRNERFDQFVIDQIAGDMLPNANLEQQVATGFHRNTLFNEEGGTDPEQFRVERTVDRANTTGTVFLGVTIGCAQCHDHKYDPFTQREYYQFFAFFNNADEPTVDVPSSDQLAAGELERRAALRKKIAELEEQFKPQRELYDQAEIAWEASLTEDQKKTLPFQVLNAVNLSRKDRTEELNRQLNDHFSSLEPTRKQFPVLDEIYHLKMQEPTFAQTMVMQERSEPRETFIHLRGDFLNHGVAVGPSTPEVLPSLSPRAERADRLDLAKWLVDAQNPLTPRVTMNRLWQQYFGRGLVETENDFGVQGTPPTHPELLDWLASQFIIEGWDLKAMHRLLVTSATYRQASVQPAELVVRDPSNRLLARQSRLRLDSELIRDSALRASGLLTSKLGGASVYPPQPDGVFEFTQDKKPWPTAVNEDRFRRAMYTYLWRSSPYPALSVFDFPDANVTCTRRIRSNTPLQSLTLANDMTFVEFARGLARRIMSQVPADDTARIEAAYQMVLSRKPRPAEIARLTVFVAAQRVRYAEDTVAASQLAMGDTEATPLDVAERATWTSAARILFNLDEFITRE